MKHLIVVLFCATLVAQVPLRQTHIQIFDRPNSTVTRQQFSGGTINVYNVMGARRVVLSSAGGLSTTTGIIEVYTGAAGAEVMRARLDSVGLRTTGAIRLEAPGGYFEWLPDPAIATNVSLKAPATMDAGCLYHDGAGATSFQPCATGNFVTLDTAQIITGIKTFKAAVVVEDAAFTVDRSVLGSGSLQLNTSGGHGRVTLSSSSALDSGTGIVRVSSGAPGSEFTVAEMASGGVNVNGPASYRFNGSGGTTVTCAPGQYPNNFSTGGGLVLGATCTTLPSGGGDMLLGTAQTVTAQKIFQMSVGGDAILIRNSLSQVRGAWSDATFRVGDIATGFGRGIQLSTGGTLSVFNTSSQEAVRLSTSGSSGSISVFDSGTGILWSGITLTCSVGQTVRQPIHVAGLLVSGGCGL